jgi:hypothetical protein
MTVITGATIPAARNPDVKSEASRRPRFFVFHTLGWAFAFAASWFFGLGKTPMGCVGRLELRVPVSFGSIFDMDMSRSVIEGLMARALESTIVTSNS